MWLVFYDINLVYIQGRSWKGERGGMYKYRLYLSYDHFVLCERKWEIKILYFLKIIIVCRQQSRLKENVNILRKIISFSLYVCRFIWQHKAVRKSIRHDIDVCGKPLKIFRYFFFLIGWLAVSIHPSPFLRLCLQSK